MQFNLFYKYSFTQKQVCEKKTTTHILVYILSGNILIKEAQNQTYKPGEWIFIPKGNTLYLQPGENKNFTGFVLTFTPRFLNHFHHQIQNNKKLPGKGQGRIIRLTKTPDTESLYYSLLPYYYYEKEPTPEIMNLKLKAAIYCLLQNKTCLLNIFSV